MKIKHCSPDKSARVKQLLAQAQAAGMEWGAHRFQFAGESRIEILSRALALQLDPTIENVEWRCQANTSVNFSREEFLAFAAAVVAHGETLRKQSWAMKDG